MFSDKQRGVIRGVVPAAAATVVGFGAGSLLIPVSALAADEPAARIAWTLQWAVLPIFSLMIFIMRVANHRFSTPEDIDGSGLTSGTSRILVLRAILQNTLEQAVLAVAVYMIWAAVMPHSWLRAVPVAALLFVAGRILFASGYEGGAAGRAMGFGLTAYPTFGMLTTLATFLAWRILH